MTPGYYRDPEPNTRAFDAEGYFLTGDLGALDSAGRLHFHGHLKDLIKSGGINISPFEVEDYLMTHPKVQYAAVVGLPDAVKGEVPAAAVELRAGEGATAEEVLALPGPRRQLQGPGPGDLPAPGRVAADEHREGAEDGAARGDGGAPAVIRWPMDPEPWRRCLSRPMRGGV